MGVFFCYGKLRPLEPTRRWFDYQREADEGTPVSEANERLCNSSEAQSSPSGPTIKKTARANRVMVADELIWLPEIFIEPKNNLICAKDRRVKWLFEKLCPEEIVIRCICFLILSGD